MKKHTLIHSGVAVDNPHQYNVVIGTDMGQFSGTVICREEDYDHESKFFGFELAELKAEIEYARAKKRFYSAQQKALQEFWRDMSSTRTYDIDAFWVKKMRERLDIIDEKRIYWTTRVAHLRNVYHVRVVTFDTLKQRRNRCEEYNND